MFEESASSLSSSLWESMNSWLTPTVLFVLLNVMIGTIAFTSSLTNQKHQTQPQNDPNQDKIVRSPSVIQRLKSINFYSSHHRSHEPQNTSLHHKSTPDSDTLFNIEQTHQAQTVETQSHYFFHENPQITPQSQAHYIFEQTHEHNSQETQSHIVYEEKDSNIVDFQLAHEEKVKEDEFQSIDDVYSQLKDSHSHFNRTKSDTEPASGEIPVKLPKKMKKSASSKSAFGHFEEGDIVEARRPATVKERGNAKITEDDEEVDAKADDFINKFKQQLKLQRLDSIIRYKDMIGRGTGAR